MENYYFRISDTNMLVCITDETMNSYHSTIFVKVRYVSDNLLYEHQALSLLREWSIVKLVSHIRKNNRGIYRNINNDRFIWLGRLDPNKFKSNVTYYSSSVLETL